MAKIWLVGGTRESAELARLLVQAALSCVVTVTTESARSLYLGSPFLTVCVGRLAPDAIAPFLHQHQIAAILDASHPFAVAVSKLAIAASVDFGLPYLRYERPSLDASDGLTFPSFESLLATPLLAGKRVLLTVGYRPLHYFHPWQTRATLFTRILPSQDALAAAIAAGFSSDRIIALRPPISAELERSLWRQWLISAVVTKASGVPGGEDVKRQVAAELGVTLVEISRPDVPYPQQTDDQNAALSFCLRALSH